MARDHARVNLSIWQDPDWRQLPPLAQHLYLVLWTHPELSYAGVVDWRPGRLAPQAGGWTKADVVKAADCLEARLFIVRDEDTEECLIRSWFKWDGLLKQPVMAVSFANAYAAVASNTIRGVIVHEANRYYEKHPELSGWKKPQVSDLLGMPSLDPCSRDLPTDPFTPGVTPPVTPAVTPALTLDGGVEAYPTANTPSTPAPAPPPITPAPARPRRKPETTIPAGWEPNDNHREQARAQRVNIDQEAAAFKDHAQANDRRLRDWDAGFRMWLSKARPQPGYRPARPDTDRRVMSDFTEAEWLALPVEQRALIAQRSTSGHLS